MKARPEVGSAAGLFVFLWETLSNVSGPLPPPRFSPRHETGIAVRAWTRGAADRHEDFTYRSRLPGAWRAPDNAKARAAFDRLFGELIPLLATLTGRVVVRRLAGLEPFAARELLVKREPPL